MEETGENEWRGRKRIREKRGVNRRGEKKVNEGKMGGANKRTE